MNFDRNTIIGFVVLALLFIGYFFYTTREQQAYQQSRAKQDSITNANKPKPDTLALKQDSVRVDSFQKLTNAGLFIGADTGSQQLTIVQTDVIKIAFTNKGGQPAWVELKNFKAPDSTNVRLASTDFDKIIYPVNTATNQTTNVTDLYFSGGEVVKNADNTQIITYQLQSAQNTSIVHEFVIKPSNYMIDFNIRMTGADQLLTNNTISLVWQNKATQLQKDLEYEKQQSFIGYRENGGFDNEQIAGDTNLDFDKSLNWLSVKQQFFNTTLIAKNDFSSGSVEWAVPAQASDETVVQSVANLKLKLPANGVAPLAIYYGPNDYKILKQYDNEMESMVDLGSGIFAFVKYINRWIVLPAFDLFTKLTSNFGIVILLLTFFIRLLTSPLMYKSYLSSAKMKVLKPEIEVLKAKHGTNQQQMFIEQQKMFKEAGVNMLGGCIPGLLQIPIFFALYSFFNSNVALRNQSFLWADDLSQYDSILSLPFNIPFYGEHISLFTITACITSFFISIYSMSMTPDQSNPVLKYMPYIFPFILLFVFNKLPAALTWYYTVSNIITLLMQFIILKYIINHDKILANIEINRKKPKTKSKWQERFEQVQQQQQRKIQEQKTRK